MTKPDLGTKHLCPGCGAKFYDLKRTPITCPKCGTVVSIVVKGARTAAKAAPVEAEVKPDPAEEKDDQVDTVSLEDADAEQMAGSKSVIDDDDADDDDDIEDNADVDDAFLEDDEDDDAVPAIVVSRDGDEET